MRAVPACWNGIGDGFDRWLEIIWRLGVGGLVLGLKPVSIMQRVAAAADRAVPRIETARAG